MLLQVGCSWTFDRDAPEIPLIGVEPDTKSLPRLNDRPVQSELFARGADGQIWLGMFNNDESWRFVRMTGAEPGAVETVEFGEYDDVVVTSRAMYLSKRVRATDQPDGGSGDGGVADGGVIDPGADDATKTVTITVRAIGEQPGSSFIFPDGSAILFSGGLDSVFTYMVLDPKLPGYYIQRRDSSFRRIVPWPKGVDPANPFGKGNFFWDGDGNVFYDRNADGRLVAHYSRANIDVDLGVHPPYMAWLDAGHVITCGIDGVNFVTLDGVTPTKLLDPSLCATTGLFTGSGYVYYVVGEQLRKVKIDGTEPPQDVFDLGDRRTLYVHTPDDTIFYSTDPVDRYVHGAGDGWLGGWKFMQRGSGLSVLNDRKRLLWLEHSAQNSGAGELSLVDLSAPGKPGGTIRRLARNVRDYQILSDGRIICDPNHAFNGVHNRIVVLDPDRNNAQWMAASASRWAGIPRTNDYIVDLVTGATGHDIVRVPLPPIFPPVPPNH